MRQKQWLNIVFVLALLAGLLPAALGAPKPVSATLGWVGNMFPGGGTTNTITAGGSFDVYVQVRKDGVTNSTGQGANIACYLRWATVPFWGGGWTSITDTPMSYHTDSGNNDEYKATITPGVGIYEFTAYCKDTTDNSESWQTAGNGKLIVNTASGDCNTAAPANNNIYWNGLLHDSFSTAYRNPLGAVSTGAGTVTLNFRTCMNDLNAAPQIRIWDDKNDAGSLVSMSFKSHVDGGSTGSVTYWTYDVLVPASANIYYYIFKATDGTATAFYRDDNPQFYGGGLGQAEGTESTAYSNSYQLTIYDSAYAVPEWMQRAVVYQVFPDRFRDGDASNNPTTGRFSYARSGGAIVRSNQLDWNTTVCDPRDIYTPGCTNYYGDNFYGGDLRGVIQKLEDGYFQNLGVSVLYLNPIFLSPSNHKYDTADFMLIDPDFGTLADFQELVAKANARGIRVMLDGVFNHTSSDSRYFDRYSRYDASGALINPTGGADDNSGACESPNATYRNWFYIPDTIGSPGGSAGDRCDADDSDDPTGAWTLTYTSWWGYGSLPKLQATSTSVRDLFFAQSLNSVGPYWTQQGASAWRFDVGDDVDAGLTNAPTNTFWEDFRTAVRNPAVTGKSDVVMLGEIWGDASSWLLGNEWDSVMNYRFRSTLLNWLFTGCSGNGCTSGTKFVDNDSNDGSSSGPIEAISPSQLNARLRSIQEDYPPMAWKAMMNLEGSHDTNRVRFLLKKINNDNDAAAVQRMKEWWLFSFTYAGAPTLYYGDEIGLNHDGVWTTKWEDDPYNRVPYPWDDATGNSYSYDSNATTAELQRFARSMASIRWSYRALQDGDVQHGIVIDDANKLYGFARTNGSQTALIVLNRDSAAHSVTLSNLNGAPYNLTDGTVLVDAVHGASTYTVSGGSVTVSVNPTYGVVLLEQNKIDIPETPVNLTAQPQSGSYVLTWDAVTTDTAGGREVIPTYTVHRDTDSNFTPGAANLIYIAYAPAYGNADNKVTYTDSGPFLRADPYYSICAHTGAWYETLTSACTDPVPTAVFLTSFAAIPQGEDILVSWETAAELQNLGFNLYRSEAFAGPWVKLNAELVPAQNPGGTFGASYEWLDTGVTPDVTYFYRLEDVDVNGASTFHGPVSATTAGVTAVAITGFGAQGSAPAVLLLALAMAATGYWKLRRKRA